jgi:hypothetical protein
VLLGWDAQWWDTDSELQRDQQGTMLGENLTPVADAQYSCRQMEYGDVSLLNDAGMIASNPLTATPPPRTPPLPFPPAGPIKPAARILAATAVGSVGEQRELEMMRAVAGAGGLGSPGAGAGSGGAPAGLGATPAVQLGRAGRTGTGTARKVKGFAPGAVGDGLALAVSSGKVLHLPGVNAAAAARYGMSLSDLEFKAG